MVDFYGKNKQENVYKTERKFNEIIMEKCNENETKILQKFTNIID